MSAALFEVDLHRLQGQLTFHFLVLHTLWLLVLSRLFSILYDHVQSNKRYVKVKR